MMFLLQLKKEVVDDYEPGREIPHFAFGVNLKDANNPRPLRARVHFDGVDQEEPYITIRRNPDIPAPGL